MEIPTWVSDGYVVYKLLPRALYLPDFAPSDFLLFPNLKKWVTGRIYFKYGGHYWDKCSFCQADEIVYSILKIKGCYNIISPSIFGFTEDNVKKICKNCVFFLSCTELELPSYRREEKGEGEGEGKESEGTVLTLSPFSSLRMKVIWIQSTRFFQTFHKCSYVVHFVFEYPVSCHIRQVTEFHVQCTKFWEYTGTSTCPTIVLACLQKYSTKKH